MYLRIGSRAHDQVPTSYYGLIPLIFTNIPRFVNTYIPTYVLFVMFIHLFICIVLALGGEGVVGKVDQRLRFAQ
jgi:hypothetical protein